jgi:hypothetical protein
MATTSHALSKRLAAAVLGAAVISGGVAWFAARTADTAPPETRSFWSYLTPEVSEVDPPDDAAEAATRSEAVVLAHVTGVSEGREDKACLEVAPTGGCSIPKTVFVQLTVDRTVRGSVERGQVLNLEMFRPPRPLTLDAAREAMPAGRSLFFLSNKGEVRTAQNVWGVISLSRGVIAQGSDGLFAALDPSPPNDEFVRSFGATTVDQAADAVLAANG